MSHSGLKIAGSKNIHSFCNLVSPNSLASNQYSMDEVAKKLHFYLYIAFVIFLISSIPFLSHSLNGNGMMLKRLEQKKIEAHAIQCFHFSSFSSFKIFLNFFEIFLKFFEIL